MSDEDTGMAAPGSVSHHVDSTCGTTVSSMSTYDRASRLIRDVNYTLRLEGVPPVAWDFGAPHGMSGTFDAGQWTMYLNEQYFSPEGADTATLEDSSRETMQTMYHEAGHAEQTFRGARERIGLGATVEQVIEAMAHKAPAPPWVVERAAHKPIVHCDCAQYQAEAWYQNVYGSGAERRCRRLTHPEDAGDDAA